MILIYQTYDKNSVEMDIKHFKSRINIDIIPVLAKEKYIFDDCIIKPYGIDYLLKKTIKKCENRRKNIKYY